MHLKELTINGFKSFAKKSELEFSAQITAIVGPNGSGKSNVAEAFRFVLGEQSPSKMRGKKGEDLIFNGSTSSARANRASVVITLNNEKRLFPLDFDEITIERTVLRDGSNEYSINGSKVRLKDVQELLAVANIGPSGHHIISQGEADRILSASPRERREMIEDALGLKVYQFKKIDSEKKLAKTLENIAHVESLRKEVQPHLKFLEKQVKKIERSLALQEELKDTYAEYLKREDTYIAFHHDRLMMERAKPEGRLALLKDELDTARAQLESEERDETSDALMQLESEITDVRRKRQEIVRESGSIDGQITFLKRRVEERSTKADEDEPPIAYREVKKVAEMAEAAAEKARSSTDPGVLGRALHDIVGMFHTLLRSSHARERDQAAANEEKELAELMKEKAHVDKELASFEEKDRELDATYQKLKAEIETEASKSREAEREVFRIMNEQREAESELRRIEESLAAFERDRDEFKRELQEAVVLIGSAASAYFKHEVMVDGKPLSNESIVAEDRGTQRERRRQLEKMKVRLEELGAGSTEDIMKEYTDVKERDEFLVREITDLDQSVEKLEALIADLTSQLDEQFVAGTEKIGKEFNTFFTLMFGGGEAKLTRVKPKKRKKKDEDELEEMPEEAVDEEEEERVEEGIDIDVKLPNKRVRGLEMLSGGERALTSIALIFAMSQVNPPLFVILDETDAALDEANSRRYGDMITSLAKRSQLILITHNRETMSRAGVLYGVTMGGDGVSKLLSVKFDEAVAVAK